MPETLRALLAEVGRVYVPFLLANAAALERGAEQVECIIDGRPWTQRPFPYQGKCLRWLREGYAALGARDGRSSTRCSPAPVATPSSPTRTDDDSAGHAGVHGGACPASRGPRSPWNP